MATEFNHAYRYLDTEVERQQLVDDIHHIRQQVIDLAATVPEAERYQPRYHGWTLGAMLGHLQLMDNLQLWTLKLALLGLKIPIGTGLWNAFNDFMSGTVFKNRLVETSLRGLERNEPRISEFIMQVPMNKFSLTVFDPPSSRYITVEQAMQKWFLFHWHEHFRTMQIGEGLISPDELEMPNEYDDEIDMDL
ncbi:MAG: hypothetical protein D6737_03600 [Chloroflexi bacterium]|nr:MAG: hypothetical protein D6737_03600 [Chloroflexota bacterium]